MGGKDLSDCFPICTHILGMLPSRQIALGTGKHSERRFLPVLYLLPCSSAPVCCRQPRRLKAPGQTVTVHSELDGLSLSREEIETDHHITVLSISISLPPGNPIILIQIIISRVWWLAHLDALMKELQQKGFLSLSQAHYCTPKISHWFVSDKFQTYHTDNLISGCQTNCWNGTKLWIVNEWV